MDKPKGKIQLLQEMGLWVIAQRYPVFDASTDAIIGTETHLMEAHTEEVTAVERLMCIQVYDDSDRQTLLLEPHWNVWTQVDRSAPIEKRASFASKKLAEGFANTWLPNYYAVWICTVHNEVNNLAYLPKAQVISNAVPNAALNDSDFPF